MNFSDFTWSSDDSKAFVEAVAEQERWNCSDTAFGEAKTEKLNPAELIGVYDVTSKNYFVCV